MGSREQRKGESLVFFHKIRRAYPEDHYKGIQMGKDQVEYSAMSVCV